MGTTTAPDIIIPTTTPQDITTTAEPYNCKTHDLWSLDKKAWCCKKYGVGCPTPPPPKPAPVPPAPVPVPPAPVPMPTPPPEPNCMWRRMWRLRRDNGTQLLRE